MRTENVENIQIIWSLKGVLKKKKGSRECDLLSGSDNYLHFELAARMYNQPSRKDDLETG